MLAFDAVFESLPSATNSANFIGISVDGVIGYAATTSGFTCLIASAKARLPEVISFLLSDMVCDPPRIFPAFPALAAEIRFRMHRYRPYGTYLVTYPAPFAEKHVYPVHLSFSVRLYRGVGTLQPAFQAGYALVRSRMGRMLRQTCLDILADAPHAIVPGDVLPALRLAHASTASSRPRRMALRLASSTETGSCFIFLVK